MGYNITSHGIIPHHLLVLPHCLHLPWDNASAFVSLTRTVYNCVVKLGQHLQPASHLSLRFFKIVRVNFFHKGMAGNGKQPTPRQTSLSLWCGSAQCSTFSLFCSVLYFLSVLLSALLSLCSAQCSTFSLFCSVLYFLSVLLSALLSLCSAQCSTFSLFCSVLYFLSVLLSALLSLCSAQCSTGVGQYPFFSIRHQREYSTQTIPTGICV